MLTGQWHSGAWWTVMCLHCNKHWVRGRSIGSAAWSKNKAGIQWLPGLIHSSYNPSLVPQTCPILAYKWCIPITCPHVIFTVQFISQLIFSQCLQISDVFLGKTVWYNERLLGVEPKCDNSPSMNNLLLLEVLLADNLQLSAPSEIASATESHFSQGHAPFQGGPHSITDLLVYVGIFMLWHLSPTWDHSAGNCSLA